MSIKSFLGLGFLAYFTNCGLLSTGLNVGVASTTPAACSVTNANLGISGTLPTTTIPLPNTNANVIATTGPAPLVCNEVRVQPIHEGYHADQNGNEERFTSRWAHQAENHEAAEVVDQNDNVHIRHRWVDRDGRNHQSDHWSDHRNGHSFHCDRFVAPDGCVHEITLEIDSIGNKRVTHLKRDVRGIVTEIIDSQPANLGVALSSSLQPSEVPTNSVVHAPGCPAGNLQANC